MLVGDLCHTPGLHAAGHTGPPMGSAGIQDATESDRLRMA